MSDIPDSALIFGPTIQRLFNPAGWTPMVFVTVWAFFVGVKKLVDPVLEFLLHNVLRLKELDMGTGRVKGLDRLQAIDLTFLLINSVIEFVHIANVYHFLTTSNVLARGSGEVTLFNTLVAFPLLFVLDDLLYSLYHWFMHWPPIYPYIHKHHHRQILPRRGVADAANENPIEMLGGLALLWLTLYLVARSPLGLHVYSASAMIFVYSLFGILNHTRYDINIYLPFKYSVKAHQMHHRYFTCNYAQNCMWWDQYLLKSYREYVPPL